LIVDIVAGVCEHDSIFRVDHRLARMLAEDVPLSLNVAILRDCHPAFLKTGSQRLSHGCLIEFAM